MSKKGKQNRTKQNRRVQQSRGKEEKTEKLKSLLNKQVKSGRKRAKSCHSARFESDKVCKKVSVHKKHVCMYMCMHVSVCVLWVLV